MKIYDLTLTLTPDLVVWEGDAPIEIGRPFQLEKGDEYNLSTLKMSVHAGTHVDAPRHFLPEGKGVDQLNAEALSGPVSVIDVRGYARIDRIILQDLSLSDSVRRRIIQNGIFYIQGLLFAILWHWMKRLQTGWSNTA